jgi:hypothetical protein
MLFNYIHRAAGKYLEGIYLKGVSHPEGGESIPERKKFMFCPLWRDREIEIKLTLV